MSAISDLKQSTTASSVPREFLVSVELYIPTIANFGLRKVSLVCLFHLVSLTAHSQ